MLAKTCPDDQTLQDLLLGRVPVAVHESWESHLLTCADCAGRAANLSGSDNLTRGIKSPSQFELDLTSVEALVKRGLQIFEETRAPSADETADILGDMAANIESSNTGATDASHSWSFLDAAHDGSELGRLGGYRILRLLGQGGMGMVFLAEEEALHRQVALKVMSPSLSGNESARLRFLREARAMAAVVNDHIVPIHQVGEHKQIPFLAMPLLQGENLGDCLKREGKLSIAQVCRLGKEIASGLAAAHSRGLIHRDIKPDNIWLEAPLGRVKILDFGLARAQEDNELTQSGTVMGTPKYMSPEQAEGHEVDQRSDLFSLGSLLYHSIAGKTPFEGKSLAATLMSVISTEPQSLPELREETPAELSALISKLMTKAVNDRPSSAESVAADFARLEQQLASTPPTEQQTATPKAQPTSQAKASNSNRGPLAIYAVAAALALIFVLLLASVVIKWKTPGGTVYVTIDSADSVANVDVSQDSLTITDPNDNMKILVTIDEANGKMRFEKDGFSAVMTEFNLSSPDGRNIAVKFVPNEPEVIPEISRDVAMPNIAAMEVVEKEREIAQWIIGQGGTVQVQYANVERSESIASIDGLPQEGFFIRVLVLTKVERESDLAVLSQLSGEVSVWLPGTEITGTCFEHLGKIPKLDGLNLQGCKNIDPTNVMMLSSAQMLEGILLLNSNLGDEVAELVTQIDSLSYVDFGSLLTKDGLQALKDCKHVTQIGLHSCSLLTSDDLRYLQDIPNLNIVAINPNQVDATSIKHLASVSGLKILRVIDINSTGALHASLLSELDSLAELDLSYGVVTVEQLEPLQEMQSLRRLGLRGTGLSKADLARVRALLPRCELETDAGVLPRAESEQ